MKYALLLLISFAITSCGGPYYYYQLHRINSEDVAKKNGSYVYKNDEISVAYDFWGNYGNPGFILYNKTNRYLYLDKAKCQFVFNGKSSDYYQNRMFSSSEVVSSTVSISNSSFLQLFTDSKSEGYGIDVSTSETAVNENSVTYQEKQIVAIPPKSKRYISEFNVVNNIYRNCSLLKYPDEDEITPIVFSKDDSPYMFSNYITYSFDRSSEKETTIKNDFWVERIVNYPEESFIDYKYMEYCGEKSYRQKKYFIYDAPDKYYIKYLDSGYEDFSR